MFCRLAGTRSQRVSCLNSIFMTICHNYLLWKVHVPREHLLRMSFPFVVLEQRSTLTAITTHDDQQPRRQEYYSTTGTKTYSLGYSFRPEWPSRTIDEQ